MSAASLSDQMAQHRRIVDHLINHPETWEDTATPSAVTYVETHGASVLLGNDFALKIKKPVFMDHMDYSTAEKRRYFCEQEARINSPTAPDMYIGVLAITKNSDGKFDLQPAPQKSATEYLVKMIRFADQDRFDRLVKRGDFTDSLQDALADTITTLHRTAKPIFREEETPDFHCVIDANFLQLEKSDLSFLTKDEASQYRKQLHHQTDSLSEKLDKRRTDGWVRQGHGDLHLQNICLLNGQPTLFDAIEYNPDFMVSDVLYDMAFLLMDLWNKDQKHAANRIFNRYLASMEWVTSPENLEALSVLPFYLSLRAGIRTQAAANKYRQAISKADTQAAAQDARTMFDAAERALSPAPAELVAIGGFSGSGKSTLARALAPFIGAAPGALHLRSDVLRRQLIGWDEFSPMPQSAYTSDMSEKVYELMRRAATKALKAGHSVIMDAVLDRPQDQSSFEDVAIRSGATFTGIWLEVETQKMLDRVSTRTRDASDATTEIVELQLSKKPYGVTKWNRIDGNGSPAHVLGNALNLFKNDPN